MRLAILLPAICVVTLSSESCLASPSGPEIKAALVYNIARFTNWADEQSSATERDTLVCLEQDEPLAKPLLEFHGKPAGAGRFMVQQQTWPFSRQCNIAYVSRHRIESETLRKLTARGVLTIGDTPDFYRIGAIGIVQVGRQMRFEINNTAAKGAGVQLSSKLLRLAVRLR